MKKNLFKLLIIMLLCIPFSVFAEGDITLNPTSLEIEVGESKVFTISAYNVVGDVTIEQTDPEVATVSQSEWTTGVTEEKETKTVDITVTGLKVGTTDIKLTLDAATFDVEDLTGQVRTLNVNVIEKKQEEQPNEQEEEKEVNGSAIFYITTEDKNTISNIKVEIYDENNQLVYETKTDENGKIEISNLKEGNYYLYLKDVPEKYNIKNSKQNFKITKEEQNIELNIELELEKIDVPNTSKNKSSLIISILIISVCVCFFGIFILKTIYKNREV